MKINNNLIFDGDMVWACIEEKDRWCYWGEYAETINDALGLDKDETITIKNYEEFLKKSNVDITKLPRIEDTTPAMQYIYSNIVNSENNMWFVEYPDENGGEWDELNLTQEEFEKQIDSDIEKFKLYNYITKNEDDALYTAYGGLQYQFTF